jgi:uncharacterized protein involved in oxidation of intracellular sulfur
VQTILFIFNSAPFDSERVFNGIRLARQVLQDPDVTARIFALSDSVFAPIKNQNPPHLNFSISEMLSELVEAGVKVKLCGVCMDARGVADEMLVAGASRATIAELADWTVSSDKVLVF